MNAIDAPVIESGLHNSHYPTMVLLVDDQAMVVRECQLNRAVLQRRQQAFYAKAHCGHILLQGRDHALRDKSFRMLPKHLL